MATAEELLVRIDATTESLRRELRRGDQAVGSFASSVNTKLAGIDKTFSGISAGIAKVNGLLGAIGVGIGIGALVNLGRSALNLADDLQDTAAQLGVSTDALQVFRFAAAETGVQAGQLDQALLKLNTAIGDAASGDDSAENKFKALGIAFADASGAARSSEAVLADLADLIQSLPTPAERAAAAAELLGERAGPRLVPLLSGGAKGLRDFGNAARDAGQVMEKETIDRLARAQRSIEKFRNGLVIATGEVLDFLSGLQVDDATPARLAVVTREIENTKKALADLRDGGPLSAVANAFGSEARQAERLNGLLAERQRLLDKLAPGRTKDDLAVVPTAPGSLNLGDESDAEAAAKKIESAIDAVRLKIAQTAADLAEDPLGKALAENFARAGLELDDFSAKAEELRALTELQVEGDTRLAIANEALTAARDADREAVTEWNKVQEEGKQLTEDLRTPTEEYAATVERLNFLLREGAIDAEAYGRGLKQAGEDLEEADQKTKDFKDATEDAAQTIGTAFEDAVLRGEDLRGVLQGLLEDIGRIILRLTVTKPLENFLTDNLGSLGSLLGLFGPSASAGAAASQSLAAGGPLFNFAEGGSFKVGGAGGTDSQLVAFRASPNERVTVTRPDQAMGGGTSLQIGSINIDATGGTREQNADAAQQISQSLRRELQAFVKGEIRSAARPTSPLNGAFA
jgi:hypothetical protein